MSDLDHYQAFLASKAVAVSSAGLDTVPPLNAGLFPYQRDTVEFLLRAGRGAAFLDTGLGKTFCQLEWSRVVVEETKRPVLILAPLAVGAQTVREGGKFGIPVQRIWSGEDVRHGINVLNYERLHLVDPSVFGGVVLDESSILKSFAGATSRRLISAFAETPFRLACTATPAPNDHMEIGQHSQFLGVMASNEMLSRWFVADQTNMGKYRLKGYARDAFWEWVASWARAATMPSDLGDSDDGFLLPKLQHHRHEVAADISQKTDGLLFRIPDTSATAIHTEKRLSADDRADVVAELVAAEPGEPWIVWCDTDYEADALMARIPDAVEVRGSMTPEKKEKALIGFSDGDIRVLITKPKIGGFGLNWQHCARVAFAGLSFSYESYYQAVRRCWRFGQRRTVHVHTVMSSTETAIHDVITRKAGDHEVMKKAMRDAMRRATRSEVVKHPYQPTQPANLPEWISA